MTRLDDLVLAPGRSSLLSALAACLTAMGDERDRVDIAGRTALAFFVQVDDVVSPASVSMFPWAQRLPAALARLGYPATCFEADATHPLFAHTAMRAARALADASAQGRPSLVWGVHLPEFGVVKSLDVSTRQASVSTVLDGHGAATRVTLDELGRSESGQFFTLILGERVPLSSDDRAALAATLLAVLQQGHGQAASYGHMHAGLAAYAAWGRALDTGTIDPAGHAYCAYVFAELRALAPVFLQRLAAAHPPAAEALAQAAAAYRRSADALVELSSDWPFPPDPARALNARAQDGHSQLLRRAGAAEAEGLAALERALGHERASAVETSVTVAPDDDATARFSCTRDLPVRSLAPEVARLNQQLGQGTHFRALAAKDSAGRVLGHIYFAAAEHAGAALTLDDRAEGAKARGPAEPRRDASPTTDRWLYVYCVWIDKARRGLGIGRRLFVLLCEWARAHSFDGLLAEATSQPMFLHHSLYEAMGFEEIDRLENDVRLLFLPLGSKVSSARLARSAPMATPAPSARLPVLVSYGRPCPLLLATSLHIAAAARDAVAAGLPIELCEQDQPEVVVVGGRRLPFGFVPPDAAAQALAHAARAWANPRPRHS